MKIRFTLLAFIPVLLFSAVARSQSSDWTPVFLTPSGNHVLKGVEAYFKQDVCADQNVVFIRFVNTNNYAVNLQWHNAVFTKEQTWIHQEEDLKSITIPATSEITGSCSGEQVLTVNLSLFLSDTTQFKRLSTAGIVISAVN